MVKNFIAYIFSCLILTYSYSASAQDKNLEFEAIKKESWKLFYSGKYEKALKVAKHAVEKEEKKFGINTPNTVMPLNHLAELHTAAKDFSEAEKIYKKILSIIEKWLGSTHPKVADLNNNLATFYYNQKRFQQAKLYFEEALKLYKMNYGENHINVATALNNLSVVLEAEGNSIESERYKAKAILIEKNKDYPYHQAKDIRYPVRKDASIYVYDGASMISSDDESKISTTSKELFTKKKILFFVVTVKSLNSLGAVGWDLLVYADTLFEKWAEKNNSYASGFLLFISEGERAVHVIEKGEKISGLTPKLDGIKEDIILNSFRKMEFSSGIFSGVMEMVKTINLFTG